ncbi:MAG: TolC family protein [Rhodanobacter sp.]|nr:MAG: TolC family protein [Rhodanobacter sp.]TAM00952.1 MAG: TolC family protein [Rhodanobacter sp.]TAM42139.1 MAG: TolC family protein [Rhodanobacter sp.]TAN26740.1 MAG: TolC family protein [Rhodanobacter sp.]
MKMLATRSLMAGLLSLALAGCAAVPARHTPDLRQQARVLASRQLDDAGLAAAEARMGLPATTGATWTPDRITVAAWYLDPALASARAAANRAAADAAVAAQRRNPTLQLSPEKVYSGVTTAAPWTVGVALLLPLLHPGEAAARREVATAATAAARDQLALAVWQSRARVLAALRGTLLARQAQAFAMRVVQDRRAYLHNVRQRVLAGADARDTELVAELELQRAEAGLADRRARRDAAEQSLAAVLGLPWSALADARLGWPDLDTPPAPAALPASALAEDAAWNRLDLAVLLQRYRVSEAQLRLAAGTRYPAVSVAPGYKYDRGDRLFTFGLNVELPLFHGAGARIKAAVAARNEAAANVRARQLTILNALDAARADYAGRYAAWQQMQAAARMARLTAARAQAQRLSGQIGRGAELSSRVAASAAALAANDALSRALDSLGHLEDVLQHPIWPASRLTHLPTSASPSPAISADEASHAHRS